MIRSGGRRRSPPPPPGGFSFFRARGAGGAGAGVAARARAPPPPAPLEVSVIDGAPGRGRLLATLPREAELAFGDRVRLAGDITLPATFETDTGRVFDYPSYLRARAISAAMRYATLEERVEGAWSVRR